MGGKVRVGLLWRYDWRPSPRDGGGGESLARGDGHGSAAARKRPSAGAAGGQRRTSGGVGRPPVHGGRRSPMLDVCVSTIDAPPARGGGHAARPTVTARRAPGNGQASGDRRGAVRRGARPWPVTRTVRRCARPWSVGAAMAGPHGRARSRGRSPRRVAVRRFAGQWPCAGPSVGSRVSSRSMISRPGRCPQVHHRRRTDVSCAVGDYGVHLSHNEIRRGKRWCDWGALGAPIEPSSARWRWLCDWGTSSVPGRAVRGQRRKR
jgi:hypothetical protein